MQKYFITISLSISMFTGIASAQFFQTGQAARAVVGQTTFTTQNSGGVNSQITCAPNQTTNCIQSSPTTPPGIQTAASDLVFGAIGGVAYAGGMLFAADSNRLGILPNNNRVLIFNNLGIPGPTDEIPPFTARCPLCGGQANVILGQPDITTVTAPNPPTATSMRLPLGVASDGQHLAVADSANNRILLWNSIPTSTGQPADLVLGQKNFTSFLSTSATASSLRDPQGVWFQGNMLFVADTGNNRILIWNTIPTSNNQPANLVLGQPNFTSGAQYDLVNGALAVGASIMASPTSVTSDGTHLFVADLGFSRVLIWNSIPTVNQQPADVEVGQVDMSQSIADDAVHMCFSNGVDSTGTPTYPLACAKTLNYPRFALSDGTRLFIADGGNDRVLVYNTIPTTNAVAADAVLGEPDEFSDVVSSSQSILATGFPIVQSAADVTPTPTSLAWDGTNLYVADPTDFRILIFSAGQPNVSMSGIVNSASQAIFAQASVLIGGTIQENDTVTVTIGANASVTGTDYTYKVLSTDTLDTVAQGIVAAINSSNSGAGDPNVLVYDQIGLATIIIVARIPGPNGNNITLTIATAPTSSVMITATATGATLAGGGAAGQAAPGTLVSINGTGLADTTASAPQGAQTPNLPFELGGVEVYSDGNRMPLLMVSPTQINTQIPWEVTGSNSTSVYVRTQHADGSVTVTDAIGVPLVEAGAPGIFAASGTNEPRVGQAYHSSSFASAVVVVGDVPLLTTAADGTTTSSTQAGDTGILTIGNRPYTYTTQVGDTVASITAAYVALINADPEVNATAAPAAVGSAIVITAKVPGPLGNGIIVNTEVTTAAANTGGALLSLSANSSSLCCANVADRPVSALNPATPGETIYFLGTGLGLVCTGQYLDPLNNCLEGDPAKAALITGSAYTGPAANEPLSPLNATVAGGSATVISAGLVPGTNGIYQIVIALPNTLTVNPFTQLFIQQQFNASNIVTMPVGNPLNF
jgi:uncharacterized protein (TIGR03437 family)